MQTSADNVYILHPTAETKTTVTVSWKGREWPVEKAILRPCLHDAPLPAFARPTPDARIIFPYEISSSARGRIVAQLIQPAAFRKQYPQCWDYLKARRAELEKRKVSGGAVDKQQWYQYGRSQSLTKFDTPKIIVRVLSLEARYAYDDTNITIPGGGNGPYYMIRPRAGSGVSSHLLLAILNHPIAEAFVRTNTSPFRGGYYSHGKQFIAPIPIPVPAALERVAIEQLVAGLIDALQAAASAKTPHKKRLYEREAVDLRGQVETAVSALYGLSLADVEIARAVPVPT